MLQLYYTLTNQKEKFEPLNPGKVTMYVCGPTVYNYIHIGNARSAVAFDTIRRYLEYRGFEVNYVSNFTDVDDKIIKASQEMNLSVKEITEKFINAFYEDTSALNVKKATLNPRVMDNMDDIIKFIEVLVQKGYAYESAGDVYYKTRKFKDYGKLSGQLIDDLEQGASSRVDDIDQDKKQDPLDFALWKKAKQGEISWDSPWGQGRPGWHIECSVMSTKYLGDTIDIHAGGQDLEFPHHENEIAQSEAKTGKKFARYWLHNGFVTIGEEDQKMSKSLGNFVTVHDLLKEVNPQVIRFFMSTTQYRRPIRYSSANLNEAKVNLNKLQTAYENLSYRLKDSVEGNDKEVEVNFANLEKDFVKVMDDDFNVQNGISVVYEMAKQLNVYSEKEKVYTD
ncbi:cysteine--tRNA ligase, partial [Lactobacillus salivarius]|nr:cysteine--tRNA ligase [Ligilactobacillus salivarius]